MRTRHAGFTITLLLAGAVVPAAGQIVVDHQPTRSGGPAADTDFINMFGQERWQLLADDFSASTPATIRRVSAWGFYDLDNPPSQETMRIRFYDARPGDGLPGNVLYEQEFSSFSRAATGHIVGVHDGVREFFYTFDLPTPVALSASTPYWIEIIQIDDVLTNWRWEDSISGGRSIAFENLAFPDWTVANGSDLAFQLSTVPEPASAALISLALLSLVAARRRSAYRVVKVSLSREWRYCHAREIRSRLVFLYRHYPSHCGSESGRLSAVADDIRQWSH